MAKTAHVSAQEHSSTFTSRQRTIALIVVALAFVMDLLDGTIVNVAVPTIQANLHATYATIQWLLAGYSLTFALLLITGGRMGDVFGYKKIFMIGVAGFTVASLLSGVSTSSGMLIAARLIQGGMAALMVPQVISLMQVMYKPSERAGINGLFGALGGVAAALGPVVGGLLIKANIAGLDWRPIFLINVPVGIFGLLLAQKYLPNGKSSHPLKLDLVGTAIVLIVMTLLVYPLIQGRQAGWPHWTYAMLIASIPVLALFVWQQRRKMARDGSPLIVLSLFHKITFSAGLLANLLFESAMLSFFLTFTLVLQLGLGFSAIHAALTGIPVAVGVALTMAIGGQTLIPKLGGRAMAIGAAIMAAGVVTTGLILHHYSLGVHSWQLIGGLLLVGIGMGFTFSSLFAAVLNDVDPKDAGAASGVLNAVQQVGGSIGIALIGVIFFGQLSHAAANSFATVEPQLRNTLTSQHVPAQAQNNIIAGLTQCFQDRSAQKDPSVIPLSCIRVESVSVSKQTGEALAKSAQQANATNFSHAYRSGTVFMLAVLSCVLGLSFFLPRHIRHDPLVEV